MPETIAFRPWAAAAYANTALPERKPPVPDALDRMAIALRQALAPGLAAIPPKAATSARRSGSSGRPWRASGETNSPHGRASFARP